MCKCLEESSKNIGDFLKGRINDIHQVKFCDYENKASLLKRSVVELVIGMPFKVEYYRRKKDGNPERKLTTVDVKILPTYCPFCGVKLNDE